MNNSFIVQGPKYVGDNLVSAVKDIFVQGKEVVVKGCGASESEKINAKNCCDMVTQAKIVGIFMKFLALSLAVSVGVSLITVPAASITFLVVTAIKVAALFLAADIVQLDKNTFQGVKGCEKTGEILESVGDNMKDLGNDLQNSGNSLKEKGKDWQNQKSNGGFFNSLKTKVVNVIGHGTEKLGNVVKTGGEIVEDGGNLAQKGSKVVKNQGVLATIRINLKGSKENSKDTEQETVLLNASKDTYVIRPLVRGLINCGRYLQKMRLGSSSV